MKNLTSIAEHSDYLSASTYSYMERWHLHRKRVRFGRKTLELWQFIPCKLVDGVWVVLEEAIKSELWNTTTQDGETQSLLIEYEYSKTQYQQAKEKCLFEGFEAKKLKDFYLVFFNDSEIWVSWNDLKTIEDLVKHEPLLTKTAIKQLSL